MNGKVARRLRKEAKAAKLEAPIKGRSFFKIGKRTKEWAKDLFMVGKDTVPLWKIKYRELKKNYYANRRIA